MALPFTAAISVLIDAGAIALSTNSDLVYVFVVLGICSIICIGAIAAGVQEENIGKLAIVSVYLVNSE